MQAQLRWKEACNGRHGKRRESNFGQPGGQQLCSLLSRVRKFAEPVIEHGARSVALIRCEEASLDRLVSKSGYRAREIADRLRDYIACNF